MTHREIIDQASPFPFRVTDQAGHVLPATITVHASTPLVAVEYVGDSSEQVVVPEHDLVEVARRFRRERPKAVTTIRPIRARRIVATVVVDVPDASSAAETIGEGLDQGAADPGSDAKNGAGRRSPVAESPAGDRREPSQQPPKPYPGHLAGVGMAEAECRRREENLTTGHL